MEYKDKESVVEVNVMKHKVSIIDELIVRIKHNNKCTTPCSVTEQIVQYLDDEMFLAEGFKVQEP